MIQYKDINNNIGYIPEKCDCFNILENVLYQVDNEIFDNDIIIPIPNSANYLMEYLPKDLTNKVLKINKIHMTDEMTKILSSQKAIIFDDVICHGETIKAIAQCDLKICNIKMIIILFHIISRKICLYDIEENKFTLFANNKIYYLYFIEDKFLLRIPTLVYQTQNFILMRSDIEQYGTEYSYSKNGFSIDLEEVLTLI